MPKTDKSSTAANNSTCTAPVFEWKTLPFKKINQFICKVENFVYLCIGKQPDTGITKLYERLFGRIPVAPLHPQSWLFAKTQRDTLSFCISY